MEQERDRAFTRKITTLQKVIRGWHHRRRFKQMKESCITIQKHMRAYLDQKRYERASHEFKSSICAVFPRYRVRFGLFMWCLALDLLISFVCRWPFQMKHGYLRLQALCRSRLLTQKFVDFRARMVTFQVLFFWLQLSFFAKFEFEWAYYYLFLKIKFKHLLCLNFLCKFFYLTSKVLEF